MDMLADVETDSDTVLLKLVSKDQSKRKAIEYVNKKDVSTATTWNLKILGYLRQNFAAVISNVNLKQHFGAITVESWIHFFTLVFKDETVIFLIVKRFKRCFELHESDICWFFTALLTDLRMGWSDRVIKALDDKHFKIKGNEGKDKVIPTLSVKLSENNVLQECFKTIRQKYRSTSNPTKYKKEDEE